MDETDKTSVADVGAVEQSTAPDTLPMPPVMKTAITTLIGNVGYHEGEAKRQRKDLDNLVSAFLCGVMVHDQSIDGINYEPDVQTGVFKRTPVAEPDKNTSA